MRFIRILRLTTAPGHTDTPERRRSLSQRQRTFSTVFSSNEADAWEKQFIWGVVSAHEPTKAALSSQARPAGVFEAHKVHRARIEPAPSQTPHSTHTQWLRLVWRRHRGVGCYYIVVVVGVCMFWSRPLFHCVLRRAHTSGVGGRRPLLSAHAWSLRKERVGRHLTLINTAAIALEQPPTQSCQLWRHGVCGPHARRVGAMNAGVRRTIVRWRT